MLQRNLVLRTSLLILIIRFNNRDTNSSAIFQFTIIRLVVLKLHQYNSVILRNRAVKPAIFLTGSVCRGSLRDCERR